LGCETASANEGGENAVDRGADYREAMRALVSEIAVYAEARAPVFIIVPQNGEQLLTLDGEPEGPLAVPYLEAIDGQGRKDLFYGYSRDNVVTPQSETPRMRGFPDRAVSAGKTVLVTDYCSAVAYMDESYRRNREAGYVGFAAPRRELDSIPAYPLQPFEAKPEAVETLSQARNFLCLLDTGPFPDRLAFVSELSATAYDLFIIDAFVEGAGLTFRLAAGLPRPHSRGGLRRGIPGYHRRVRVL
jgi:cysteinyl-tRNA synthetase